MLGIIWFFSSHILTSFALFLIDKYTIERTAILTLLLDLFILTLVIFHRKTKPFSLKGLFKCDLSLKPVLIPTLICIFAIPFTLLKHEFFGMGQDQGVYQTQAVMFINGDTHKQKDFKEYHTITDTEEQNGFIYEVRRLGGYDIQSRNYPKTSYNYEISPVSGIIHGIPTHSAILALWGSLFGIEHMADVETIFYLCLIFLVWCICRNLKLKPISCAIASITTALAPVVIWVSKSSLTEIYLSLLPALFIYILTDRYNKNERWLSILPIILFGCFHVSIYTMLPIFLMVYAILYFTSRKRQFAILLPLTVLVYLASYFGMRHIQPMYTIKNYRSVFCKYINVMNITNTVVIVCTILLLLIFIYIYLINRLHKKQVTVNFNELLSSSKLARISVVVLLLLLLLYIAYKSINSFSAWNQFNHLTILGFITNTGIVIMPIAFIISLFKMKYILKSNSRIVITLMFFYCILVYSAFLRFGIQYYYYYSRYLAPFIPIAVIFGVMVLNKFARRTMIVASVILIIMGFQAVTMGLLGDTIAANRKILEDVQYRVRKMECDASK